MDHDPTEPKGVPRRGQLLFAVASAAFAAFLLLSYPSQTEWIENTQLFAQPGWWPAVAVAGMAAFGGAHLVRLWRREGRRAGGRFWREDRSEAIRWAGAFEFAGWFLAYVFVVPVVGYVFASAIVMPALVWRLGYRTRGMLAVAVVFAVMVVVAFKAFLNVNIPGGAIYEAFPGALRAFFIQNL